MPGNGVGDRVHNFFAQDNLPQGPRGDGNWPLNDNLWVGNNNNQKQFNVSDSSPRNFNPQQSETERGHGSQRVDPHLFNLTQTRPEFAKNLSNSNSNGYMYTRQNFQTPPNEANFLGVETEYNRNNVNQRGFPFYDSQQEPVPEEPPKIPFRSESSEPHSGFDLFGGQSQHQMNNSQYPGFMQPLQPQQQQQQQFGDIQQLQQQLMLRKMQELQRQELQRQQEQQNSINQASIFARQTSGSHINGAPNSDWAEVAVGTANTNWLHRGAPQVQGTSGGLAFSPEQSQPNRSMGFVNQQVVDQSLYGVPVSTSRTPQNQFPHHQQQNQFHGNHFVVPDKSLFGNTSTQGHIGELKPPPQVQNVVAQDLFGSVVEDKSGNSEAALDPDEEKILFGSDDSNIWEAFGNSGKSTGGGVSSLLDDNNEFGNSLPSSLQSGSWSALMQSAVAETITSGAGPQEDWPDLNFQNPQIPLIKQNEITPSIPVNHSKQMNSGGSNWLNTKQNNWNQNESVNVIPSGFNINEDNKQSDWKRVMHNGINQGEGISGINPRGVHVNINRGNIVHGNQFSQNNNQLNYWKNVDSKSRGSENSERSQGRVNKGPQVSESSFNSSDKEDLKMHERENSNDSYRSSSSHLPNTNFSSDVGDSRAKPSFSSQSNRKPSGQRKFQYHPMGNLDEDVGLPYGRTPQSNISKNIPLQGNFSHTKSGKEIDGVSKGLNDMRFKGMIPGHVTDLFAPHDRSDKQTQPSQNMLELLHKVDQSRDRGITRQMNSLERNLSSEIPEPENSDGSFGGQQKSQSSNSQGIGLQLGPPSQRLPLPNHGPQRALQNVKPNLMNQTQVSNSRGKSNNQSNLSPFQTSSSHEGEFKNDRMNNISSQSPNDHKMVTNLSTALGSEFSNSRNQFQNQSRNQTLTASQSEETRVKVGEKFPASQPRGNSGAFPKMWANIPTQQLFSATQPRKSQSQSQSQGQVQNQSQSNIAMSHALNIVESTSSGQQNVESTKESEKVDRDLPGVNDLSSSVASQKDLEAFGRSLKPNNNFSLPNMKNTENDPNKRLKEHDNLKGSHVHVHGQGQGQQVGPWSGQPREHTPPTVPPQDSEMPAVLLKEVEQNGSQNSVKTEHFPHVSPQMAPTWFDQYGTVKPGQMMSQRGEAVKSVSVEVHDKEHGSGVGDHSQTVVISKPFIPVEQTNIIVQNLRPKKRKYSTRELHPWVKEVSGTSKNVHDICNASMEWCTATNRLMEKVEDDGEVIEDVSKPKRRIITTTQLMQQLFPPPPVTILSSDDNLNHESVAFYASRMSLGDSCNLLSSTKSSNSHSHNTSNPLSDKKKTNDHHIEEVVEDSISKSKRLENEFSRLDKRASILDLRVECQDLEKFSIINRFARFHGRGQSDVEGASSSDGPANTPKSFPQRYVIAVPLPKNLPERVQCLSL